MTAKVPEERAVGDGAGSARARLTQHCLLQRLGSRGGLALIALWLLAGALATRQAAVVLRQPSDERLTDLIGWLGDNGVLRSPGSFYDVADPFTGTPFAGMVLKPLSRVEQGIGVVWTFGTLLLVVAVGLLVVRSLPGPLGRRGTLFAVPVALSLLVLSLPVRSTFTLGQIGILPVLLVLLGWLGIRRQRAAGAADDADRADGRLGGVLIGLAAALQPGVLLFLPLLWCTGRRSGAVAAGTTFAGGTTLAWLAAPADSWTYWVHHIAGVGLGESSDDVANQSLHGLLLRLGLRGPLEIVLLLALGGVVCWFALRRAVYYARDGQPLLAAALAGCAVVAVSPTAWQHQQLWILLALVGRVGRRTGDRLMWPVLVVLVMSLESRALVPNMPVMTDIGANAPLIAALAAACLVPFLSRDSERWAHPEPSGPLSRPNLMLELLLVRVGYFGYSYVRAHASGGRATSEGHGQQILDLEGLLRLDWEHGLNHFTARTPWLESFCNFYYTTFHFLVPITLLVLLYVRRPRDYRSARTALSFATLLGLVGFWFYPLAPPRLMPGLGYIDTAHGPQDLSDPEFGALTEMSNQYAAMPSLHVGWSLWCGIVILGMTSKLWLRVLGILYPLLTTFVVMATANHYLLDAVAGAGVVLGGFGLQRLVGRLRQGESEAERTGVPEVADTGPEASKATGARQPPAEREPAVPSLAGSPDTAGGVGGAGATATSSPTDNGAAGAERADAP